jgi:organic radical activating enzyme
MEREFSYLKEIHHKLAKEFGDSFCFSKWYQANIYFQTGETHSCYHPTPHSISQESIAKSPSALHNTVEKISERSMMLKGERPKGCQYCWNIEDLEPELISDRQIRSGAIYRDQLVEEVRSHGADFQFLPEYVELSFSNECNFACGYCHPKSSSRYFQEIKRFGPFQKVKNHQNSIENLVIYPEENNPYLDAWWRWWPTLKERLTILRITGGEPLIQKSCLKMLKLLDEYPAPNLELKINSNLGAKEELVSSYFEKIQDLFSNKKIKGFELFSSLDGWGKRAEYIRYGLNLEIFEKNLKNFLNANNFPVTIMITFQLFSIATLKELMQKILEWREEFPSFSNDGSHRIRFDLSYLKEPLQYDMHLLPKVAYQNYLLDVLSFVEKNMDDSRPNAFSFMDFQRIKRLLLYFNSNPYPSEKISIGRKDFFHFFEQIDQRRGLDKYQVFPELREFFALCEWENLRAISAAKSDIQNQEFHAWP